VKFEQQSRVNLSLLRNGIVTTNNHQAIQQLLDRLVIRRLVTDYSLNKLAFQHVLGAIESRFARAAANPGAQLRFEQQSRVNLSLLRNGIVTTNNHQAIQQLLDSLSAASLQTIRSTSLHSSMCWVLSKAVSLVRQPTPRRLRSCALNSKVALT
jgi:ribosomal protein S6